VYKRTVIVGVGLAVAFGMALGMSLALALAVSPPGSAMARRSAGNRCRAPEAKIPVAGWFINFIMRFLFERRLFETPRPCEQGMGSGE
jgi:hypothetical protein